METSVSLEKEEAAIVPIHGPFTGSF